MDPQHLAEGETTHLLQTIPGIGLILAHVLRAEIGPLVERFPCRHTLHKAFIRRVSGTASPRLANSTGTCQLAAACRDFNPPPLPDRRR